MLLLKPVRALLARNKSFSKIESPYSWRLFGRFGYWKLLSSRTMSTLSNFSQWYDKRDIWVDQSDRLSRMSCLVSVNRPDAVMHNSTHYRLRSLMSQKTMMRRMVFRGRQRMDLPLAMYLWSSNMWTTISQDYWNAAMWYVFTCCLKQITCIPGNVRSFEIAPNRCVTSCGRLFSNTK